MKNMVFTCGEISKPSWPMSTPASNVPVTEPSANLPILKLPTQ